MNNFLTTKQAAIRLNVDEATIRRWCISSKIHAIKFGGIWIIPIESIGGITRSKMGRPEKQ
jgi:excisionase family DNA binding protein